MFGKVLCWSTPRSVGRSVMHSADSRKKELQGGAIIKAYCSIKRGLSVASKRALLNQVQDTCFEHFKPVRIFTSIIMTSDGTKEVLAPPPSPTKFSEDASSPFKIFQTVICLFILLTDFFNFCHQLSFLPNFFFFFFLNYWNFVNFREKFHALTFSSKEYHLEISTRISSKIFCLLILNFFFFFFFSKIKKILICFWNWTDPETGKPELLPDLHFQHVGWKVADLCAL